ELNPWLARVLLRVTRVVDVGANDGYFTFGCAAAFERLGKAGEIIAFEPLEDQIVKLRESIRDGRNGGTRIALIQNLVGREEGPGITTLDAVRWQFGNGSDRSDTLLKIDVEGAELNVLMGGTSWLTPSNLFIIEVHSEALLCPIKQLFAERGLSIQQVE